MQVILVAVRLLSIFLNPVWLFTVSDKMLCCVKATSAVWIRYDCASYMQRDGVISSIYKITRRRVSVKTTEKRRAEVQVKGKQYVTKWRIGTFRIIVTVEN